VGTIIKHSKLAQQKKMPSIIRCNSQHPNNIGEWLVMFAPIIAMLIRREVQQILLTKAH